MEFKDDVVYAFQKPLEDRKHFVHIKLSEDILQGLTEGKAMSVKFGEKLGDNVISFDKSAWNFTKTKETQAVDVLSFKGGKSACIIGKIDERINLKKELEASKRSEIRSKSEEAEKSRLSRKCVLLSDIQTPQNKKGTKTELLKKEMKVKEKPAVAAATPSSLSSVKNRIIQMLALKPNTAMQLSKMLNSPISDVQQVAKKELSTGSYALNHEEYKNVKIYDWPQYSAKDREKVIENTKKAFNILGMGKESEEWKILEAPAVKVKAEKKIEEVPVVEETKKPVKSEKKPAKRKLQNESMEPIESVETKKPRSVEMEQKYKILVESHNEKCAKYNNLSSLLQKDIELFSKLESEWKQAASPQDAKLIRKKINEEFKKRIENHLEVESKLQALRSEIEQIKASIQKLCDQVSS